MAQPEPCCDWVAVARICVDPTASPTKETRLGPVCITLIMRWPSSMPVRWLPGDSELLLLGWLITPQIQTAGHANLFIMIHRGMELEINFETQGKAGACRRQLLHCLFEARSNGPAVLSKYILITISYFHSVTIRGGRVCNVQLTIKCNGKK